MSNRREFMTKILGGTATLAVSGLSASNKILGANDRVRFGLIGAGGRGKEILKAAVQCPNTQAVAVADLYTRRLDEAKQIVPDAKPYSDFRRLLDDKSIDAVLIASPHHQHALNFIPAVQAGKDIYQEKTMAFNPDHARRMRRALEGSGRVVQVGIQSTSGPAVQRVNEHLNPASMGTITAIHTHHYRNKPYGGWKREIPPDCDLQHVDWNTFQGEVTAHPFDPNRFINWRFFWDYSGGNVFENMVHQVGFWFKLLNLQVPSKVTMVGANLLSPEMELPDTMDVCMVHPGKVLFTWNSMFGNQYYGEGYDLLLGDKGTIIRDENELVHYEAQGKKGTAVMESSSPSQKPPDIIGVGDPLTLAHMQNFFDCVRSRKQPNCPFEIGFRSAMACRMAIASYGLGRTVLWDEAHEDIV
jgi:predicted dehydrogenase